MPTTAKLVAALLFAGLSWLVAGLYAQGLPVSVRTGWLRPVAAAVGLIFGWRISGRLVGRGMADGAANGLRSAVTIAFAVTFIFATHDMVIKAFRKLYPGPLEAVLDIFKLMLDYGQWMLEARFLAALVLGGMICGVITEWVSRRWR